MGERARPLRYEGLACFGVSCVVTHEEGRVGFPLTSEPINHRAAILQAPVLHGNRKDRRC